MRGAGCSLLPHVTRCHVAAAQAARRYAMPPATRHHPATPRRGRPLLISNPAPTWRHVAAALAQQQHVVVQRHAHRVAVVLLPRGAHVLGAQRGPLLGWPVRRVRLVGRRGVGRLVAPPTARPCCEAFRSALPHTATLAAGTRAAHAGQRARHAPPSAQTSHLPQRRGVLLHLRHQLRLGAAQPQLAGRQGARQEARHLALAQRGALLRGGGGSRCGQAIRQGRAAGTDLVGPRPVMPTPFFSAPSPAQPPLVLHAPLHAAGCDMRSHRQPAPGPPPHPRPAHPPAQGPLCIATSSLAMQRPLHPP